MRVWIFVVMVALIVGCAGTSKESCEQWIDSAAAVSVLIADAATKGDEAPELVARLAGIVDEASGAGCDLVGADSLED